jgi:hypothetical protein
MGKSFRHTRKQSSGRPALRAAGLLGASLLSLPLASAAGRFGLDGQNGIVEIAAADVGMQDLTPMVLTPMVCLECQRCPELFIASTEGCQSE